jgi:hypothetical protein
MYVDVAVVLRGRSIGAVFFTGAFRPVPGRDRSGPRRRSAALTPPGEPHAAIIARCASA